MIFFNRNSDDEQGEDPSIEVSNSQPSQIIYEKESHIKLDYGELEEGKYYCHQYLFYCTPLTK